MKININDLDIHDKSWNYGMQKIAEKIIAEAYGIQPDQIVLTTADFGKLVFKGYNFMDWNEKFKLTLKIAPKLEFKHEKRNV